MSDRQGARAISLVTRGKITEDRDARVFYAEGSGGSYRVALGSRPGCTCEAGTHGRVCYHLRAARLLVARERVEGER